LAQLPIVFAARTPFLHYPTMKKISGLPQVALRPFAREDFGRLISWVRSEAALVEWCAGFFRHPLDDAQLDRYLESSKQPNARAIWVAETSDGDPVCHVEISQIWPHLSSRLSRVLVAPDYRRRGIGSAMIAKALSFSFRQHHVSRIDLGVSGGQRNSDCVLRKAGVHACRNVAGRHRGRRGKDRRLLDDGEARPMERL
jgi:RimJ/RimL family protein N-acetyltransferase